MVITKIGWGKGSRFKGSGFKGLGFKPRHSHEVETSHHPRFPKLLHVSEPANGPYEIQGHLLQIASASHLPCLGFCILA